MGGGRGTRRTVRNVPAMTGQMLAFRFVPRAAAGFVASGVATMVVAAAISANDADLCQASMFIDKARVCPTSHQMQKARFPRLRTEYRVTAKTEGAILGQSIQKRECSPSDVEKKTTKNKGCRIKKKKKKRCPKKKKKKKKKKK